MWDVLKGALTRHMLRLFLVLALVPLLIVGVVSGVLRVQNQDRTVQALEADLREKASGQILAQARHQADLLERALLHRTAVAVLLAEHGQRLLETGSMAQGLGLQEDAPAAVAMSWSVAQDRAVRAAFVQLPGQAEWIVPAISGRIDHRQLFSDWDPASPPASGEPADVAWRITYTGQGAVLVLAAPVWSGNRAVGIAGLELWLDRVIDEAPRDGLVGRSSLLLVSSDARFAALQSWSHDSFRWSRLPPLAFRAGRSLSEFLPDDAATALDAADFQAHLAQREPLVLPVDLEDQSAYMAFQAVGGTPLSVALVLPLAEVWSLAEYYGAPLRVSILPTVIEMVVALLTFLVAVSLGAFFTLRQIAQPIRELSSGAQAIMEGRLSHRVPQEGPDELRDLARSFNSMAEAVGQGQAELQASQAQLAQALVARQTQFEVINDVASVANHAQDLNGKLSCVLGMVCPAVVADDGAVVLVKEDQSMVTLAQLQGPPLGGDGSPLALRAEALVREALANDRVHQAPVAAVADGDPSGWYAAVPVRLRGSDRGAIVFERRAPAGFDADSLSFLEALATHVGVLVENANLQNELRYVVLWEERRRLARELHDSVTQTVFTLSLAAEGLRAGLPEPRPEVREALDFLVAQAERARQEMRGLINELRPIDLGSETLAQAIRVHASSLQRATGLKVKPAIQGDIGRLSPHVQHNMNRVLQEALSNVMRHARAHEVAICLSVDGGTAELRVSDDGLGFAAPVAGSEHMGSLGLISMRERAEAMGGTLSVTSSLGAGTTVIVRAPIQPREEESNLE